MSTLTLSLQRCIITSITLVLALGCELSAFARSTDHPLEQEAGVVQIRRTQDGIPHISARSWRGLGYGVGFAQTQDALCTLAEGFLTYQGHRSMYFGAAGKPSENSTFGRPKNVDLDFFFRSVANQTTLARYRAAQPIEIQQLAAGFANGYNRYLMMARNRPNKSGGPTCIDQPWVKAIQADDVYRRMYAAQLMAGYAQFIPQIANAAPQRAKRKDEHETAALNARMAAQVGDDPALGSNMIAFGRQATGGDGSLLFGNPHWYWGGPDRFYQMHLTIPGALDIAGAGFLGIPVVMIGFTDHIAWSHTVSRARRFGLFELSLDQDDPTRYKVDGIYEPMRRQLINVKTLQADGSLATVTRTLYSTRYGPVIDLTAKNPALGWEAEHALAIRDINARNFRVFSNFLAWARARTLDQFIAIQKSHASLPWVNTAAIGQADGRVWYADIGAVPYVTEELRKLCATALSAGFNAQEPSTPFLDGSRSECDWRTADAGAAPAGAMPASKMPFLLREDYVANMNDSYWLSNPAAPLEGYARVLGGERQPLSLRGREGHRLARWLMNSGATSARELARLTMYGVLESRAYSADQFKKALLDEVCAEKGSSISLGSAPATADDETLSRRAAACSVLRRWDNRATADARGALLWEAFWEGLMKASKGKPYRVPFSPDAPLTTPRDPFLVPELLDKVLDDAINEISRQGHALDAPAGDARYVVIGGRRVPLYGGCAGAGYFTVVCGSHDTGRLDAGVIGNSYMQLVYFDDEGVVAHTMLAHGEKETALAGGRGGEPVMRYARRDWLPFPFHEADVNASLIESRLLYLP